ncbi:hypothetical protein IWQ62_004089 [Dispira parvispora]|uniref:Serine aminopeptidase S33 domain-containing protein n=1 Tax=Dispira parvispora TaxID=1520584 RepID=A0A9W8ALL3_9FUNG|nr:hypothetical protein IWQ62_004089 [Dispira parvispora]
MSNVETSELACSSTQVTNPDVPVDQGVAPQSTLVLPTEPVDEEKEGWVTVSGLPIYTMWYRAKQQPPVATLLVVHGFGEHSGRYIHVCRAFAQAGVQVLAYDQRGYGRTGRKSGRMGRTDGLSRLHQDILELQDHVRLEGVPHFLLGHSMGGMEVMTFLHRYQSQARLSGVISTGPCIRLAKPARPNPVVGGVGSFFSKFFKSLTITTGLRLEDISRDEKVVEAARNDYYRYDIGSLQCLDDLINAGGQLLRSDLSHINCPVLIAHGTKDAITDFDASQELYDKLPSTLDKEFCIYPDCYHELHNELNKEEVIGKFIVWVKAHVQSSNEPTSK